MTILDLFIWAAHKNAEKFPLRVYDPIYDDALELEEKRIEICKENGKDVVIIQ